MPNFNPSTGALTTLVETTLQKYLQYINEESGLLSLLYDIDLMPEQIRGVLQVNPSVACANTKRMVAVCELWKRQSPVSVSAQ